MLHAPAFCRVGGAPARTSFLWARPSWGGARQRAGPFEQETL